MKKDVLIIGKFGVICLNSERCKLTIKIKCEGGERVISLAKGRKEVLMALAQLLNSLR